MTSPHRGQLRVALMFSFICICINYWVNNGETGDLRRYRAYYDVTVMFHLDDDCLINMRLNYQAPDINYCDEPLCGHHFQWHMVLNFIYLWYVECSWKSVSGLKHFRWCFYRFSIGVFFRNCSLHCQCRSLEETIILYLALCWHFFQNWYFNHHIYNKISMRLH